MEEKQNGGMINGAAVDDTDDVFQSFNSTLKRIKELNNAGETLPLSNSLGRIQEAVRLCADGHAILLRVFGIEIGKQTSKKSEYFDSIKSFYKKKPRHCEQVILRLAQLLETHLMQKEIPMDLFLNTTLSYDKGATVSYFGRGAIEAMSLVLKRQGISHPYIDFSSHEYIVTANKIHTSPADNAKMQALDKRNVYFVEKSIVREDLPDLIWVDRGMNVFIGVRGTVIHNDKELKMLYMLPAASFKTTNYPDKTALYNHPLQFLNRKFKNYVYKQLFGDLGIDIEVNDEGDYVAQDDSDDPYGG